jgi:hypothetical protein
MKEITEQQIIDYINEQPADKKVDMREPMSSAECGCVMVHYAKDKIKGFADRPITCGFSTFTSITKKGRHSNRHLEMSISAIVPWNRWDMIRTYGDIQELLKTRIQ